MTLKKHLGNTNLRLLIIATQIVTTIMTATCYGAENCSSPFMYNVREQLSIPLCYWRTKTILNFGDHLSLALVERMIDEHVEVYKHNAKVHKRKLLAIGSILALASDNDIVWGSGINGKRLDHHAYRFSQLDVRAVRGPLTRKYLLENFNIQSPEIYGDPALLIPYFFPEFIREKNPTYDYVIIPHYSEERYFPKSLYPNVVYPTDPWEVVVKKILDSKFVISSSLHGIIVAEAYGIPARLLKITYNEPLFKYEDYYLGTNRPNFTFATSVKEALLMGGEKPFQCDLQKLYQAFPFELWPNHNMKQINFNP